MHIAKITINPVVVLCLALLMPNILFAADCPVRFLNRSDAAEIDQGFRDKIIPRIGDYQKAVVQNALNALPPIVCASVGRVVFVYDSSKVAVAFTNTTKMINDGRPADLIYFNDYAMPEQRLKPLTVPVDGVEKDAQEINRLGAIHDVIHEAIHVADHLLDSQRKDDSWLGEDPVDENLWSNNPGAVSMAKETVRNNRLGMGFRQEWKRMHDAFVAAGMAREYYGKTGGADLKDIVKITGEEDPEGNPVAAKDQFGREIMIKPAPIELAAAGFMTQYGGTKLSEDIAEVGAGILTRMFVERLVGGELERDSYYHAAIEDHACEALRGSDETSISSQVAAIYTKAGFLQSVGFITPEGFKRCVGDLAILGSGEGFHSYVDGDLSRSYAGNMGGGLGRNEDNGPIMFNLSGDGTVETTSGTYPVTMTLSLNVSKHRVDLSNGTNPYGHVKAEDYSFARGIYFVGFRHGKYNRLTIRRKSDGATIMDVGQGVALVSRASMDLIEGSVFVQRIFNFSGGALSAIAGDEPVKKPTKITFRYKPGGS